MVGRGPPHLYPLGTCLANSSMILIRAFEQLDSYRTQTYSNGELLVSDDASTDSGHTG